MFFSKRTMQLWLLAGALGLCFGVVADDADARRWRKGDGGRSGHVSKQTTRTGPAGRQHSWRKDTDWSLRRGAARRETTWTGPRGGQAHRSDRARRTGEGWQRDTTWTDRKGRTATREVDGHIDRDAGIRTRDVTWTGRDGQTRTRQDVTTRTEDGYNRNSTFTDARGRTATRDADVHVDRDAGTRARDVTWTGRDGATRTHEHVATRTEDGYTRDSTFTGRNGQTATRSATVSRDPEAGTRTKTVEWEGPNGGTFSHVTETVRTENGHQSVTTVTRPDGSVVTYERDISRERY
jgi:hypothetical protein